MDLSEALSIIKDALKSEYVESRHFKDQCQDRQLDIDVIKKLIMNPEILGITEQNENQYKIWLKYDSRKDLNIILGILPDKKLRLVTLFPSYIERRIRNERRKG